MTKISHFSIFFVSSTLILFTISEDLKAEETGEAAIAKDLATLDAGNIDRFAGSGNSAIELNAFTDSSQAAIKIARKKSTTSKSGIGIVSTWAVTASAPINKDSNTTDLATLDALTDSSSFEVKFSQLLTESLNLQGLGQSEEIRRFVRDRCIASGDCKDEQDALKKFGEGEIGVDKKQIAKFMPRIQDEVENAFWDSEKERFFLWDSKRNRFLWGASGKIGYQSFNFLQENSLNKQDASRTPWSVAGFASILPADFDAALTGGLEYQSAFKNADQQTVCGPPDGNGLQQCQTAPVGGPVDNDKFLLSLEGRKIFTDLPLEPAASLKLTYDLKDDIFGVDAPVFLLRDTDSNLNGGVRFGWRDDTNDFLVGVFVGSTFSLF